MYFFGHLSKSISVLALPAKERSFSPASVNIVHFILCAISCIEYSLTFWIRSRGELAPNTGTLCAIFYFDPMSKLIIVLITALTIASFPFSMSSRIDCSWSIQASYILITPSSAMHAAILSSNAAALGAKYPHAITYQSYSLRIHYLFFSISLSFR